MYTARLLLITGLFLFVFISIPHKLLHAQNSGIGVTAGINSTSHLNSFRFVVDDIDLDFSPNFTSGFHGGLIIRSAISQAVRFQMEPTLIVLGARYEETFNLRGFNFESESQTKLTYVQLPLLLQFSTIPPQRTVYGRQFNFTTFHFSGGLFGGYLLDAKFTGTNSGAPVGIEFQGDFSNDVMNQYSTFDGGVIIGTGFESGREAKLGFETRLMFSVLSSGNSTEFDFTPRNIGVLMSAYILF